MTAPLVRGHADVVVLLPAGASPHGFEPRPSDALLLSNAVLRIGLHADVDGWMSALTAEPVAFVFESGMDTENIHDQHEHSDDAHVWMDPVRFQEGLPVISRLLCEAMPDACPLIEQRRDSLGALWTELDDEIQLRLNEHADRPHVVVALPFLNPLLERYNVPYLGPLQSIPGQMSSPAHMAAVMEQVQSTGAHVLLTQTILNDRGIQQFARDADLEVIALDPVGNNHTEYVAYIREIVSLLHAARQ